MLLKFGVIAVGASGKQGGSVVARNRYGIYTRAWAKPINPSSLPQQQVRSIMSAAATAWQSLTSAQVSGWNAYAAAIPWLNRLGDTVYLTAPAMFRSCYCARVRMGVTAVTTPPAVLAKPQSDPSLAFTATTSTQTLAVTFNNTLTWAGTTGGYLALYVGVPQLQTTNFFKGPWLYLGKVAGVTGTPPASPFSIVSSRTFAAGQKLWLSARACQADGRVSDRFDTFCVCIT